jgi:hypothetical protein
MPQPLSSSNHQPSQPGSPRSGAQDPRYDAGHMKQHADDVLGSCDNQVGAMLRPKGGQR